MSKLERFFFISTLSGLCSVTKKYFFFVSFNFSNIFVLFVKGIYSFNLFDVLPKWEVNYKNPATTQFNNRNRIAKEVAYLNINDAKWTQ